MQADVLKLPIGKRADWHLGFSLAIGWGVLFQNPPKGVRKKRLCAGRAARPRQRARAPRRPGGGCGCGPCLEGILFGVVPHSFVCVWFLLLPLRARRPPSAVRPPRRPPSAVRPPRRPLTHTHSLARSLARPLLFGVLFF